MHIKFNSWLRLLVVAGTVVFGGWWTVSETVNLISGGGNSSDHLFFVLIALILASWIIIGPRELAAMRSLRRITGEKIANAYLFIRQHLELSAARIRNLAGLIFQSPFNRPQTEP